MTLRTSHTCAGRSVPLLALTAVACALQGCRSPQEHRQDADREVYEILTELRDDLAVPGAFTIDPPEGTLRERLLAGEETGLEQLTLLQCLEIAAENSRNYRTQREALYLEALDLTLERWNFSSLESGSFGSFLSGSGRDAEGAGVLSNLGIAKLLGTGLQILGDVSIDLVRDVSSGDGWDAVSNLSLNITQPLLRGYGRKIVTEPLTQAGRNVIYQARAYESFRRDLALDVANRYYRILSLYDQLTNEEANFVRRSTLRERNEAFAQAGQITDVDVDQARQEELDARNRVVNAKRNLEDALDDFKFFLGLPVETLIGLDPESREELASIEALDRAIGEELATRVALVERLDLQTTRDRIYDAERRLNIAANQLEAGLQVGLTGSATSPEGRPTDISNPDITWTLDVNFDAPFERLPERNVYRAALISLEVAKRNTEQATDGVRADIRDSIRRLNAARESYLIQTGAVELAERRVESSQLNLEAGRAETRDVLESQDALVRAQNDAIITLTDYLLAGLDLYRDMELFHVEEEGFVLKTELLESNQP